MARLNVGRTVGSLGNSLGGSLGEYLRDQRRQAELSLRQLAEQAGVSNPYLSQIERGLRRPSAEVLQQLAKALRVSAETLYVRAGILEPDTEGVGTVELAVLSDPKLNERQRRVLLDIYDSFVHANGATPDPDDSPRAATDAAAAAAADTRQTRT